MKRVMKICAVALPVLALATAPLSADVKTKDRSQFKLEGMLGRMINIFGGKAAKEGIVGTTAVKGNRKATLNESTGQIVDLSEEKVYDLDMKKKTYTVMTFEEIRRRMREEAERAKQEADKAEKEGKEQPEPQPEQPAKELDVDFDVKETGQKKQIAGYDTREVVLTATVREKGKTLEDGGGLVMTTNEWLGPVIPEMKELAEFELKYAKQLAGPEAVAAAQQLAAAIAMFPLMKDAMARMQKDSAKLQGTPLESTTVFEAVKSKEQLAQAQQQQSSGGSGGIGGMLARKMMKREEPKARGTIVTLHNEYLEVSKSVDASDLAIPPDFKQKK
ncbi:MAG: hypothetical protein HOQ29_06500 [Acidobacteria bacterium]|nr:hypothetical protein [Acidobacteriota bacterium]